MRDAIAWVITLPCAAGVLGGWPAALLTLLVVVAVGPIGRMAAREMRR